MSILIYKEQLKDKRWIELSDKIKARDKICQMCGCTEKLEVHHTCYISGLNAWQYDEMYLITLCRECHQRETNDIKSIKQWIKEALKAGMFASEIKDKLSEVVKI